MMKTDIEIAHLKPLLPITEIAARLGVPSDEVIPYGKYKAKVEPKNNPTGKLILVTAINPTKLGEGKTTTAIGLTDALRLEGRNVSLAIREPSLGPVFGIKGGAAGGGYSQVAPMEDINLHFTGDIHAITAANNLLSALIDNHIYFGNELKIDTVVWRRCMDMNDRALREIAIPGRKDGFDITAASEIMAILCLSEDIDDLKRRLSAIIVGYTKEGAPVTAGQLKAEEAMTILLKDAIKPNLVQTLGGSPAFVHGGPFANIAHGCNSIIATKTALSYSDYVVTEAGFGADLGAEKFFDIKCRIAGLKPAAVVLVATVRALKLNGGGDKFDSEDVGSLRKGLCNLEAHIANLKAFGIPVVVALNRFATDTDKEVETVGELCNEKGVEWYCSDVHTKGGEGARELARAVIRLADMPSRLSFMYESDETIESKILKLAKMYGAGAVEYSDEAKESIERIRKISEGSPVCIAKTPLSLSDNPDLHGAPKGFTLKIREIYYRGGSGLTVAIAGNIMLMPGLPAVPNSAKMTIDKAGNITGLF